MDTTSKKNAIGLSVILFAAISALAFAFHLSPTVHADPDDVVDIAINKIWDDDDNADGVRPTTILFSLYTSDGSVAKDSSGNDTQPVSVSSTAIMPYTLWSGVPKYDTGGSEISYVVKELDQSNNVVENGGDIDSNYTVSYGSYAVQYGSLETYVYTITNSHAPAGGSGTINIPVSKIWEHISNPTAAVKAGLFKKSDLQSATGQLTENDAVDVVALNSSNNYSNTFTDVDPNEEYVIMEIYDGKAYGNGTNSYGSSYTTVYIDNTWYSVSVIQTGNSATITNSPLVYIRYQKTFEGTGYNNATGVGIPPWQLRVYRKIEGDPGWEGLSSTTLSWNGSGDYVNFTHAFLPKYDSEGNEYIYKVVELYGNGVYQDGDQVTLSDGVTYNVSVTSQVIGNNLNSWVVKNIAHTEKVDVSVIKIWDDEDDRDGTRPPSIALGLFRCYENGDMVLIGSVVLDTTNSALPIYSFTFSALEKWDPDGQYINYCVYELNMMTNNPIMDYDMTRDGYTVSYDRPRNNEVKIMNSYCPRMKDYKFQIQDSVTKDIIINIQKVDEETGNALANAEFDIYDSSGNKLNTEPVKTGSDGKATFTISKTIEYGTSIYTVTDYAYFNGGQDNTPNVSLPSDQQAAMEQEAATKRADALAEIAAYRDGIYLKEVKAPAGYVKRDDNITQ